jgi:hypothetical protein
MSMALKKLIEEIRFREENPAPHLLPGIFLVSSLFVISSIIFVVITEGEEALGKVWYSNLAMLYIGYILASAYSSYRLLKNTHRHLVDSGIVSYAKAREINDLEAIRKLYIGGLLRRDIPSSLTGFILGIVSAGLSYPVILYIVEKNLRRHIVGEEKTFLGSTSIRVIGVENLLIDLAATLLTFGAYMIYWPYRVIKVYNTHINTMHKGEVKPRRVMEGVIEEYTQPPTYPEPLTSSPILILGLTLIGIGVTGLTGAMGLMVHLPVAVAIGLLLALQSYKWRNTGLAVQVFGILSYIYIFSILISIAGYLGSPGYLGFYETTRETVSRLISRNYWVLVRSIYVNNLAIALLELVPVIGLIYLGIGVGNASIFIGVSAALTRHGGLTVLSLYLSPHTFLEFLAYAVMASASTRIIVWRGWKNFVLILVGLGILLLAAMVESLLVILFR